MRVGIRSFAGAILLPLVACGGVKYAVAVNAASARLAEARADGAEELSPYEYYFAREHLEEARVQASRASYSTAITLAEEAQMHADAAIALSQKKRPPGP